MKQCKNYLISMAPCYHYKQTRNVSITIIKKMKMMILMTIIIIVIIITMIMMMKMILTIAVVVIINNPFQPGDFSTGSTTDI